jgi:PPM family protein phosphatase
MPKKNKFNAAAETLVGKTRDDNEDAFWFDPEQALFLLADGMGGHLAGEIASQTALECYRAQILTECISNSRAHKKCILEAFHIVHEQIRVQAQRSSNILRMGTTLVTLWCPSGGDEFWIAHVGDSRAYQLRNGQLRQLTEDHTVYNQIRSAGDVAIHSLDSSLKKTLSQALGSSDFISPSVRSLRSRIGDRYLLCSDGLTDMLSDEEICTILLEQKDTASACKVLSQSADQAGGIDNITVVLVDVDDIPKDPIFSVATHRLKG